MATMNVSLPDQMKDWVEERVGSGQYANASDYVRDLIRMDQRRAEARQNLDDMVEQALASGIVQMTGEELLEHVMSKAERALDQRKPA